MPTHLVVDLYAEIEKLESKDQIVRFLLDAIRLARMDLLSGPYVWDAGFDDPNPGLTGYAAITTSHFSIHTFTNLGLAYLDLFSCKEFDTAKMVDLIKETFKPSKFRSQQVSRESISLVERAKILPITQKVRKERR